MNAKFSFLPGLESTFCEWWSSDTALYFSKRQNWEAPMTSSATVIFVASFIRIENLL